ELLVKGNSWIEGLTVLSIIVGTVIGGILIHPTVSEALQSHAWIHHLAQSRTEAAILVIAIVYFMAAATNLLIPLTHVRYPRQQTNPLKLVREFRGYIRIL